MFIIGDQHFLLAIFCHKYLHNLRFSPDFKLGGGLCFPQPLFIIIYYYYYYYYHHQSSLRIAGLVPDCKQPQ